MRIRSPVAVVIRAICMTMEGSEARGLLRPFRLENLTNASRERRVGVTMVPSLQENLSITYKG